MKKAWAMWGFLMAAALPAGAADFYVDPVNGLPSNDGGAANPWRTLEEVVSAGRFGTIIGAGDTVHLKAGYHGELVVNSGSFNPPVTLLGEPGHVARLRRARFSNASDWVLDGVSISLSHAPAYTKTTMVQVDASASSVTVRNCDIFSVPDPTSWTANDWINTAPNGMSASGQRIVFAGNRVRNTRFGINVGGTQVLLDGNIVENFSADGIRGLGDDNVFQYNVVKNAYVGPSDGDDNHDDGFQSWSTGPGGVGTGEVRNVILRGNVFIDHEDPNQPFKASMQGIGLFDGFFTGWVVENNVVVTDHWHGLSFYGARDCHIVNNTVVARSNGASIGPPWIRVNAHKDGTPSEDVLVRNNLATDFVVSGTNVVSDHNAEISWNQFSSYFQDMPGLDLRLRSGAPAVDAGSVDQAPALDADRAPRLQGTGVDLGAYEFAGAPADSMPPARPRGLRVR